MCQPPRCVTECGKMTMGKCQRRCKEPACTVVCPKADCEHGACPECKTVCSKPECTLDCGAVHNCESKCSEPICAWKCVANEKCAKEAPICKMTCDGPKVCSLGGKTESLP